MPKKYMIYGIIIVALLLLAYLLYVFNHKKVMNQTNETQNVGHFTGDRYSFDYPIFENWLTPVVTEKQIRYTRSLETNLEITVTITETKRARPVTEKYLEYSAMPKTQDGAPYSEGKTNTAYVIEFQTINSRVSISVPIMQGVEGFSSEKIRETILDSFQINTQSTITKEKAMEIAIAEAEKTNEKIGKDYKIDVELKDSNWLVYWYVPGMKGGGAPEYLIDAKTGAIISKTYSR